MSLGSFLNPLPRLTRSFARRLSRDRSGVAMIEFAFTAPLLLGAGMMGTETAFLVLTHMQVSQVAVQTADNASRIGATEVLVARQVFERDINEVLVGTEKLGETIAIFEQGRVILSSLQQNADGGQEIRWQRCRGAKQWNSSFGVEGDGENGTGFPGMGTPGAEITASPTTAVMFVEVAYDYESLTPFDIFDGRTITYTAAFNVRDARDLTQLFPGGPEAACDEFSADRP